MIHNYDFYLSNAREYKSIEIAQKKKETQEELKKDKNSKEFYPTPEELQTLPENSVLIRISFTLKKSYTSKDEGEFRIIDRDNKIFENPIVRDKFTGLPMIRPSTWKGHLRFAAGRINEINSKKLDKRTKSEIVRRLFGSEPDDNNALKGKLYFFPTFFEEKAEKDVITPLDRKTRTPVKNKAPILLEVMKPGKKGEFYILYFPYPKGKNFKNEQIKEDLRFLSEALRLMLYVYGFSAKKTSGFGVIEEKLNEGKIWVNSRMEIKEETFFSLDELDNQLIKLLGEENELLKQN